jgi:hypothetical protein
MRETRSSGSVEGVISDGHPYSDSADSLPLKSGVFGGARR